MTHFIKDLATDVALTIAATIGTVLMLTTAATLLHHTAPTQHTAPTTTGRVIPCQYYLSHGAMVTAAETNIPAAPSFCHVAGGAR